jgi:hypothetical protein
MTNTLEQISFGFGDYRLVARVWPIVVKKIPVLVPGTVP